MAGRRQRVDQVMGLKPIPETPLKRRSMRDGMPSATAAATQSRWHANSVQSPPTRCPPAVPSTGPDDTVPNAPSRWHRRSLPPTGRRGRDIGDLGTVLDIAEQSGLDRSALADAHASGEASDLLKAAVDRSLGEGCVRLRLFFIVDGEPFFGVEKMELMEEWLATGGW